MKIYLAGSCSKTNRSIVQNAATILRNRGYDVYCPWELKLPAAWEMSQEEWANRIFAIDVKMIDDADYVVVISNGHYGTAGTNWEQGYAFGKGKRVIVFQTNDSSTSIMTYCGCFAFSNLNDSMTLGNFPFEDRTVFRKNHCDTVLT